MENRRTPHPASPQDGPHRTTRVDAAGETTAREGVEKKRSIDLTFTQVAGSALAAVIAALIAGRLGVYGTIIGAGVVSVVATTGGPLFQHLFRRTGEGVRDQVMTTVRRPLPARDGGTAAPRRSGGPGRRGLALTAVLVFVLALGGLTLYELVSGTNVSGGRGGTTSVGQVLERERHRPAPEQDLPETADEKQRADTPSGAPSDGPSDGRGGGSADQDPGGTAGSGRPEDNSTPPTGDPGDGTGSTTGGGQQPTDPSTPEPAPSEGDPGSAGAEGAGTPPPPGATPTG
ncbi:hypothetical protein H3146_02505 [Streptomyces sp. OF3]|uniref:Uncharacterized protein n=1 Tax=Streptomyces alkaliterrae TaxID=2213162 RepID=A0A7W3WH28_9ACTN|nr:hypothetical protein [Streptomyces alkaliterrae]MBB1252242.1 hypothetical protein [Streptomyces alkaliterrae]